jgi:hypothetical protein
MNPKSITEMVKRQRDIAFLRLERGHKTWGMGEQEGLRADIEMVKMVAKDYTDLMEFCNYVEKNNLNEALIKARKMDTAVRDYIIDGLWELVTNYKN